MTSVKTRRLVAGFLLLDALALVLYGLYRNDILDSRFFHIARDRGFGEIVQYLKFGVVLAVLTAWRRLRPSPLLTAWQWFFLVLLLDDAIGLHEAGGELVLHLVNLPAPEGIRAKDLAEALSLLFLEGPFALYVAFRYLQAPPDLRRFSRYLALALLPLFLFGIVLDSLPLPHVEQLGEMVAMTILMAFTHGYATRANGTLRATSAPCAA